MSLENLYEIEFLGGESDENTNSSQRANYHLITKANSMLSEVR